MDQAQSAAPLPRDEVRRAITFGGDCRIPQCWRPIPLLFRNQDLYDFFDRWPNDLVPIVDYEHDPRRMFRLAVEEGLLLHGSSAVKHLASSLADVHARFDAFFVTPSETWRSTLSTQAAHTPNAFISALHIGLLFEPVYCLVGMEQYFTDFYQDPDTMERILDRLLDWQIEVACIYAAAGADAILTSDDWGTQQSLLIDPSLWRTVFKPRYEAYASAVHDAGLLVIFHSDGNLDSVFPDIVDIGFDVVNPLQPGAMNVERWAAEYKGRIAFYTGVDVQGMLPFTTAAGVRDAVRREVDRFAGDDGGLILGPTNAVTAEVPYENLVALYETLLEYR